MAGIVFGCIVPHPPALIPEIGRGLERQLSKTTGALEELARELSEHKPETLVVISPHGPGFPDAMGVSGSHLLEGNLKEWGCSGESTFLVDSELAVALQLECGLSGVPLRSSPPDSEADHGLLVPMYYLQKAAPEAVLLPLTFCNRPLSDHYGFGEAVARAAERTGRRVAVIGSGDLSHRLFPGAPNGYDPAGRAFDSAISKALSAGDAQAILNLDQELIERAGECGLRSIVILLGAVGGRDLDSRVLSYEGPFGVGYLVASIIPKKAQLDKGAAQEAHPLVRLAKETVEKYILNGRIVEPLEITSEMLRRAGVFVSIKKQGELRGCIGTFQAVQDNVALEVIANAISSATRDPRFPPVRTEELPYLSYSVDVLTSPEPVDGPEDLDARRYGVIVENGARRGLLLPDLEGVDTAEMQVQIASMKAGILPFEKVSLYRFEVERYN